MLNPRRSFLDYYKIVLERVSFDIPLFQKEYLKAKQTLHPVEGALLDRWVRDSGFHDRLG